MIKVVNLQKSFGSNEAVKGVELHVHNGDIFGLVGPDGAGKTTLMRMICGLITPDKGEVTIHATDSKEILGYMPQKFSLYGDLTIMENINFFGAMYKLKKQIIKERADEILELTNLIPFKDRLADNLSGGMKQKLALTCALITRPKILVLDEPTYGVDPESRKEFWKILYQLNKEGLTIMVSTPYMDEAELCNVVAFMDNGAVKAINTPSMFKSEFGYQVLEVRIGIRDPDIFNGLAGINDVTFYGDKYHVVVNNADTAKKAIIKKTKTMGVNNIQFQEINPSMEDVFILMAEKEVV